MGHIVRLKVLAMYLDSCRENRKPRGVAPFRFCLGQFGTTHGSQEERIMC